MEAKANVRSRQPAERDFAPSNVTLISSVSGWLFLRESFSSHGLTILAMEACMRWLVASASSRGREIRSGLVSLSGDFPSEIFKFFVFCFRTIMGNGEVGLGWVCGCKGSGDVETLYVNIVSSFVETVVSYKGTVRRMQRLWLQR